MLLALPPLWGDHKVRPFAPTKRSFVALSARPADTRSRKALANASANASGGGQFSKLPSGHVRAIAQRADAKGVSRVPRCERERSNLLSNSPGINGTEIFQLPTSISKADSW